MGNDRDNAPLASQNETPVKEPDRVVATFQWPPRRAINPDVEPTRSPETGPGVADNAASSERTHATSPERGLHDPEDVAPEDAPISLVRSQSRRPEEARPPLQPTTAPGSTLFQLQRTWLDLLVPSLPRRLELLGWRPEDPDAYCHRCGQTVGPHESAADGCGHCAGQRRGWSNLIRLGEYAPPLSTVVHEIKFTKWRRLARDAGRMLGTALAEAIERDRTELARFLVRPPVVVPMPMSFRRRLIRGIDHTLAIARGVKETLPCDVVQLLGRRHRPSQLDVAPSKRATNVAGTMWLRTNPERIRGRLVIVVDDVTTTGATLNAACRAIRAGIRPASGEETAKSGVGGGLRGGRKGEKARTCVLWAGVLTVTEAERDE